MPSIDQLPASESISHNAIRQAAATLDSARAAQEQTRKDLVELEQTREAAEWRDAEATEKARAVGKAEPKRSEVAAHDRKIDAARHEQKVAQLALDRAVSDLETALDTHGQAWAAEVAGAVSELDAKWNEQVARLVELHTKRSQAVRIARSALSSDHEPVTAVPLDRRQLPGFEVQSGSPTVAHVAVEDLLSGLQMLGQPEPSKVRPINEDEPASLAEWSQRKQGTAA